MGMGYVDGCLFLWRWVRRPLRIAAPLPSGRALSRAMALALGRRREGTVVELGAGTGAVTRALLAAGVVPERLVVVELDSALCRLLRRRFPALRVLHGDARHLGALLARHGVTGVTTVVSSLPLLAMPRPAREAILRESFRVMGPGAELVQYTYASRPPVPAGALAELGLSARFAGRIWLNLPPATLWRFAPGGTAVARGALRRAA